MRVITRRQLREWRVRSRRLRQQALFLLGGCLVGVAGVVMALGAASAERGFARLIAPSSFFSLLITPLGFAGIAWMTRRYFPNTEGSGIPQAIAARKLRGRDERARLVGLKLGIGKIGLTLLGLLCGASIGREGPTVQVGASIMFSAGRLWPARQPGLILAGAAAGIAAAFNTPLAGVIFGIEEMSRSFDERTNGLVIGTIVAAGLVSMAALGNYTYFGVTSATLGTAAGWAMVPICGVLGGIAAGLFSRISVEMAKGLPGGIGPRLKRHPFLFAGGCGLLVAACGIVSGDTIFGTGYGHVKAVLDQHQSLPWMFAPLKFIATALSAVAGIPGGLFSPSLAVGAGIGYDLSRLVPWASTGAIVLLGMVGYFSGVVQAPITAFVIVAEMTADNAMIVPLMATSLIGTLTARLFCEEGVYQILSRNYLRLYAAGQITPAAGAAIARTPATE